MLSYPIILQLTRQEVLPDLLPDRVFDNVEREAPRFPHQAHYLARFRWPEVVWSPVNTNSKAFGGLGSYLRIQ